MSFYLPIIAHAPYYIVMCDLSGSTLFFHIILWKLRFFGGKKLSNTKYVFWFFRCFFATFFITRRIQQDIIINVLRLHVKYLLFLSNFNETWIYSIVFRKILKYQISWKSGHWEPSSSTRTNRRADTQTWKS